MTKLMWSAIEGDPASVDEVVFTGSGALSSIFAVTDFASAAVATAALAVAELMRDAGSERVRVTIDRRLSSIWLDRKSVV